jgi:hypothetical protein
MQAVYIYIYVYTYIYIQILKICTTPSLYICIGIQVYIYIEIYRYICIYIYIYIVMYIPPTSPKTPRSHISMHPTCYSHNFMQFPIYINLEPGVDSDVWIDHSSFSTLTEYADHLASLASKREARGKALKMPPHWPTDGEYKFVERIEQWWVKSKFDEKMASPLPRKFQVADKLTDLSLKDNFSQKKAQVEFGKESACIFDMIENYRREIKTSGKAQAIEDTDDEDDDASEFFVTAPPSDLAARAPFEHVHPIHF